MMAETPATPAGAPDAQETNPFASFETEVFELGERAVEKPAEPAAAPKAKVGAQEQHGGGDSEGERGAGEGDAAEGEGGEAAGGDDTGGEGAEGAAPKPKKSAQARINELTRARHEADRRAEALQARLDAIAAEQQPPEKVENEEVAKGPPKPEDFTYGELDSGYIKALAQYHTDERWQELRSKQEKDDQEAALEREQAAAREKFTAQVEVGSEKYEDFYEKVIIGAERGEWPLSRELGQLIIESPVGADVAYHLAANPDEAAKVFRQSPLEQARYFGRMETKFSATQAAAPSEVAEEKPATKAPQAPPPLLPARGSGGKFKPSADTDDFEAFERVAVETK